MEGVIGGNSRIESEKVMELMSGLIKEDSLASIWTVKEQAMEYADGPTESYIMDSGERINMTVSDIAKILIFG